MADDEWLDHLNKLLIYLFSLFFCFAKMVNNIFEQHNKLPWTTTLCWLLSKEIESSQMWSRPFNKDSSAIVETCLRARPSSVPCAVWAAAAVVWPVVVVPCARLDVPFLFSIIYLNFLQKINQFGILLFLSRHNIWLRISVVWFFLIYWQIHFF